MSKDEATAVRLYQLCPRFVVLALACLGLLLSCNPTYSQDRHRVPGQPQNDAGTQVIDRGFLFVDGQYLSRPYRVGSSDGQISVNGVIVENIGNSVPSNRKSPRKRGKTKPVASPLRRISRGLENDAAVILFANQSVIVLDTMDTGHELLELLSDAKARQSVIVGKLDWMPSGIDISTWQRWIDTFAPTEAFLAQAKARIGQCQGIESANLAAGAAVRRLDAATYPITVLGMVLVVLSFGHLLSYNPSVVDASHPETEQTGTRNRVVYISLSLIVAFSVLDLTWTLLVSATGSMHELNPLGARLIANPGWLVTFKLATTSVAVGLLVVLRRFSIARRAAWWGCLLLTLLAIRWLVFSSMFVA